MADSSGITPGKNATPKLAISVVCRRPLSALRSACAPLRPQPKTLRAGGKYFKTIFTPRGSLLPY
jgi:hypothetical protein